MKVDLLTSTSNTLDVLYTAARTCYSKVTPQENYSNCKDTPEKKKLNLVKNCISSGHESITEHITFSFAISGVSRALLAQLTRHRVGVAFSVQSQRYVNLTDTFEYVTPDTFKKDEELLSEFNEVMSFLHTRYSNFVEKGVNPEDARSILPNATATNITFSCNLRELMHICNERLCTRAQTEVRNMTKGIVKEVLKTEGNEWLKDFLVPKCEKLGHCPESKSCGRMDGKLDV